MERVPSTELLSPAALEFVKEYHLATLSTLDASGAPHVVAVGFSYRDGVARIITGGGTQKTINILRDGRVAISQVDGVRWLTLRGRATIATDAESVATGVELYAARYRQPRENPTRVVIVVEVDSVLGSSGMKAS
jgi:PPOX class probable F420-dependent enzyme